MANLQEMQELMHLQKLSRMAKYVDITPFYEFLDLLEKKSNPLYKEYLTMLFSEIKDKLDDLPEVVLCGNCDHYSILGTCRAEGGLKKPTDCSFCCYGERREGK